MAIIAGTAFRIGIETVTPGTFVNIDGMDTWSRDSTQGSTSSPYFGDGGSPFVSLDAPSQTLTISGMFNPTDAGQLRALEVKNAGTTVDIEVLYDGTNGYTQAVRVGGGTHGATADGGPQTIAFTFAPDGTAPVIVGTGPLP